MKPNTEYLNKTPNRHVHPHAQWVGVCWHGTGGNPNNPEGTLRYNLDPKIKSSYHDLIAADGTWYQYLDPKKYSAWHAGISRWKIGATVYSGGAINESFIGVELDETNKGVPITPAQLETSARLALRYRDEYGIPLEEPYHVTHKQIAPGRKLDPTCTTVAAILAKARELDTPATVGLTFRYVPRISKSVFHRVLAERNSPCAPFAAECYSIIVQNSLDPAVALAFFAHESEYGTTGIAPLTRNWGNVRTPMDVDRTTGTHPRGFAIFRTWQDGLQDWCERINERYIDQWRLDTVEQAVPKYAPSSDGNKPQVYIDHVRSLVARWEGESSMTREQERAMAHGNLGGYQPLNGIERAWNAALDRSIDLGPATAGEGPLPERYIYRPYARGFIVFDKETGEAFPVVRI